MWTSVCEEAFQTLKYKLTYTPVLALPNFRSQFVIETDASDKGIGAVLMQQGHPIAYLSKALCPRNHGLSTYEKECLAVILAIDHWLCYLQHAPFVLRKDHKSLTYLSAQRVHTTIQQRALTKLMGLQYTIQYKQGQFNRVADALS